MSVIKKQLQAVCWKCAGTGHADNAQFSCSACSDKIWDAACAPEELKEERDKYKAAYLRTLEDYTNTHNDAEGLRLQMSERSNLYDEMVELLETIENDAKLVPNWLWMRIKSVVKRAKLGVPR